MENLIINIGIYVIGIPILLFVIYLIFGSRGGWIVFLSLTIFTSFIYLFLATMFEFFNSDISSHPFLKNIILAAPWIGILIYRLWETVFEKKQG